MTKKSTKKKEEVKEEVFDIGKLAQKLRSEYGSMEVADNIKESGEYISTGNKALDLSLGGGIAWGYVTEWSGKSGSGKTTLLQYMLADAQKKYGAYGIWVDRENAWHNKRAESLGIDLSRVIVIKPQDMPTIPDLTKLLSTTIKAIPSSEYVFVAIDSISSFADEAKVEKSDMGKKALQIHRLFRKVLPLVNIRMSMNFANHRTFKIGVLFGDPETVTGGEAPKFYTSYRVKLDDSKAIIDEKRGDEIIGNWLKARIIKTRSEPNYRKVSFPHYFKTGIPYYGGYARLLVDRNYLSAQNKKEFASFKQTTVKHGELSFNEHDIEKILKKSPELNFDVYPEWNEED